MTERATLAVLLLAYGGPQSREEVEPFLRRIMRPVEPTAEMIARAHERYQLIGGASPLIANTMLQRDALRAYFSGTGATAVAEALGGGVDVEVFVGMRHTPPHVEDGLAQALRWGAGRVVAIIMASHQSERATGGYYDDVQRALATLATSELPVKVSGSAAPEVVFVRPWHTSPSYLDGVAARVVGALAELDSGPTAADPAGDASRRPTILFSAHSLPLSGGQGDPEYERGLFETARGVMARVGDLRWRLAYQSRSGRPGTVWLGPGVEEVLAEEAARGVSSIVVVPLGFVVEHLETLYDLDIALQAEARRSGVTMARAATVRDHPAFIETLGEAVMKAVHEAGWSPTGKERDEQR